MTSVETVMESLKFGVDYYPEHWPRERWETDARLMQDLGIQIVRMAEFAWHKIEPAEGRFEFGWLDEAISLLGEHGIYTVLGTPTAAPPAWLIERFPEILPVDSFGHQKSFGGRHHDCQSNPVYRNYIKKLVTAMAEHYRENPYVIGWQIDNELGNSHEDLCMCESCRRAFDEWLEKKYQSIDRLNESWGTVFWSQTYDSFSQIPAPRKTPTAHNPSLLLDWKRFTSDLVIDFQKMQIEIIRKIAPHQKITHNLMGFYDKTDYFKLAADLDFASNDQYPTGYYFDPPGQPPYEVAACMDFIRSVKKKNFWMMELQSGATGGTVIGANPKPGQNELWTAQCVAHGADTIVYFRWRTCLFGTEQFWHGILPHQGKPGRRYYEIQKAIRKLSPVMEDIHGIITKAEAGILFSYDEDWAIKLQPQHPELTYVGTILDFYKLLYRRGIPVDFLSEQDSLEEYRLLIVPLLYLTTPELEEKLEHYVKQGGTLVLTMRTGVMDEQNVCMSEGPLPGKLSKVAGVEVEEYDCLLGRSVKLRYQEKEGTGFRWCDLLSPTTAETVVTYASDYYSGRAAVTVNRYQQGMVYYIGTQPDETVMEFLADKMCSGLQRWESGSREVEMKVRKGRKKQYLFILNHSGDRQTITIPEGWTGLQEPIMEPFETRILERSGENRE